MKKVILITGGHCAGKTTLLKRLQTEHPTAQFCFCDNDDRYKGPPETIEANFVEDLNQANSAMIVEGTRIPRYIMRALITADPTKQRYELRVIMITTPVAIAKERILQRRANAGRATAISSYLTDPGRLAYEASGARQRNAISNNALYPYKLFEVQAKSDYTEQTLIANYVRDLLSPPKTMVIQIRGTSGAGKSHAIHNLLAKLDGVKLTKNGKVQGYRLKHPNGGPDIYVVGSYDRVCGGADTIKTQDELCERVRRYAAKGHVIFEGLVHSTIFSTYLELSRSLDNRLIWAVLDTPLELCIERVNQRRADRGTVKPLDPEKSLAPKQISIHDGAVKKAMAAGQTVVYLDHTRAPEQVYEMLVDGTLDGETPRAGYRYDEGRRIALGQRERKRRSYL